MNVTLYLTTQEDVIGHISTMKAHVYLQTYAGLILLKEPSREKALPTLHVMIEMHFLLRKKTPKTYNAWSCQNLCDALTFLLDNILFDFAIRCIDK